jgi:hypothetical protein
VQERATNPAEFKSKISPLVTKRLPRPFENQEKTQSATDRSRVAPRNCISVVICNRVPSKLCMNPEIDRSIRQIIPLGKTMTFSETGMCYHLDDEERRDRHPVKTRSALIRRVQNCVDACPTRQVAAYNFEAAHRPARFIKTLLPIGASHRAAPFKKPVFISSLR